MSACLPALDPKTYRAHSLHDPRRNWPETNCYVDLWIELLHALGCEPTAALGFTVRQEFEGDQFTFFKFLPEDLEILFGTKVQELAIYDTVEVHTTEQLARGRFVLVEVDSFFLPDTRGTSYRTKHGKTTIAVNLLDAAQRRMHYFHNAGYFELSDADFDGIFRNSDMEATPSVLFPYVEFVKIESHQSQVQLSQKASELLTRHLAARPRKNPFVEYRSAFLGHLQLLLKRPIDFFHLYAFNTLRQGGANFELLGSHLLWLEREGKCDGLQRCIAACEQIASGTKALQFQLARAVNRKQLNNFDGPLDRLAQSYDMLMSDLVSHYC